MLSPWIPLDLNQAFRVEDNQVRVFVRQVELKPHQKGWKWEARGKRGDVLTGHSPKETWAKSLADFALAMMDAHSET